MDRIVMGYWACPACGQYDIEGLIDVCPGCGRRKDKDMHYYPPGQRPAYINAPNKAPQPKKIYLTEKQLRDAGIAPEECDGQHKEWVCPYCDKLNNWGDSYCIGCGSPKDASTQDYGDKEDSPSDNITEESEMKETAIEALITADEDYHNSPIVNFISIISSESFLKTSGIIALIMCIVGLITFLFYPITEETSVSSFSWNREITIEEQRTVKEDSWSLPPGGRLLYTRSEIRTYVSVIDHYDTVTEQKSRQVIDHYDTYYTYSDNGNGTFTEHEHKTPVYKTEYYTETKQKPVYREDPVYDTKYYYEIERWFPIEHYSSSGEDKNPYWNEDYTLKEKERDTARSEKYKIHYDNGDLRQTSYEEWINTDYGDMVIITKNRLGIVYKSVNTAK